MYAQLAKNNTTLKIQAIKRSVCAGWTWMVRPKFIHSKTKTRIKLLKIGKN
jgi:hypothetical protein